jgi:hypothetical protein
MLDLGWKFWEVDERKREIYLASKGGESYPYN